MSSAVEKKMVRRFQRLIRKRSLIDTGELYRSIDIVADIDDAGNVTIDLYSTDYLKYLDERYTLTYDFVNARGFNELMRDVYAEWIPYIVKKYPMLQGFEKVLNGAERRVTINIIN